MQTYVMAYYAVWDDSPEILTCQANSVLEAELKMIESKGWDVSEGHFDGIYDAHWSHPILLTDLQEKKNV